MSHPHVVVAVESTSVPEVEVALRRCLGDAFLESPEIAGLSLEIQDSGEAIKYANEFSRATGLPDDSPLWQRLDSERFRIEVTITAARGSVGHVCLDPIADAIAKALSRELSARTTLSLADGYLPFGIYAGGERTHTYKEECREYFLARDWAPVSAPRDGESAEEMR